MTARVDTIIVDGGLEVTRIVTSEQSIVVPSNIQGVPVISLGAMFLRDCHGSGNRTLVIPATVTRASEEALYSTTGIRAINYLGDFKIFNSFKWMLATDCQVTCGDGFTFEFLSEYPMSFPEFDDRILSMHQRISESTVMARLTNPVCLTEENREKYTKYMRSRSFPMAEHAIVDNDINALRSIMESGLLAEDDLAKLLENSVRSGKTSSTSYIMSFLNSRKPPERRACLD